MQKVWTDASAKKKLVSRITMHANTFLTVGTSPGRKSSLSSAMTSIWRGRGRPTSRARMVDGWTWAGQPFIAFCIICITLHN